MPMTTLWKLAALKTDLHFLTDIDEFWHEIYVFMVFVFFTDV